MSLGLCVHLGCSLYSLLLRAMDLTRLDNFRIRCLELAVENLVFEMQGFSVYADLFLSVSVTRFWVRI